MVNKILENILSNRITRNGYLNNPKGYYLGIEKPQVNHNQTVIKRLSEYRQVINVESEYRQARNE